MKLTELRPQFRQGEPEWGNTDEYSKAIAIEFDCPGCVGKPWSHRIWAPFLGRYPMDPAKTAQWTASGSGYQDLTFSDAPGHSRSIRCIGGCQSHFNVTAGAIDFYGDSGHTHYRPQEVPVTEPTDAAAPTSTQPAPQTETVKPVPRVNAPPTGYVKTHFFEWIDGILHQVHDAPHSNTDPPKVLVPVPGAAPAPAGPSLADVEALVVAKVKATVQAWEDRLAAIEKAAATPAAAPASPPSS